MSVPMHYEEIPTIMGTWARRITTPTRVIVFQKSGNDRFTYSAWKKDGNGEIVREPIIQGKTVTGVEMGMIVATLEVAE